MAQGIYRGYDRNQLEGMYSHRHRVEGYERYFERWIADSARARRDLDTVLDVSYGANAAETYDVFRAGENAPVHVFFHGGYWYSQDKTVFESMAPAFVERGATLVSVNYPLCPGVSLESLVESCRRAVAHIHAHAPDWGGDPDRLFVAGHSAGGHIVAMLLSTDWGARNDVSGDPVKGGVAISGIYELEPIRHIPINDQVRLDEASARALSPILAVPATAGDLVLGVGSNEGEEFNRQQADYADAWRAGGLACSETVLDGHNHFSIVDDYASPSGRLFDAACQQMGI